MVRTLVMFAGILLSLLLFVPFMLSMFDLQCWLYTGETMTGFDYSDTRPLGIFVSTFLSWSLAFLVFKPLPLRAPDDTFMRYPYAVLYRTPDGGQRLGNRRFYDYQDALECFKANGATAKRIVIVHPKTDEIVG